MKKYLLLLIFVSINLVSSCSPIPSALNSSILQEAEKLPKTGILKQRKNYVKSFNFTLNKLKLVESKGKSYYVLEVESHELEKLRLKYGLPKLLNGFKFHITVAIKEL